MTQVAIIGSGYAGMVCAMELLKNNIMVHVFDSKPTLGGRANTDYSHSMSIDNGNYFIFGSDTNISRVFRKIGITTNLFHQLPYFVHHSNGIKVRFFNRSAVAPLFLTALTAQGVSLSGKLVLWRALRKLVNGQAINIGNITDFVRQHKQTPLLINGFWQALCAQLFVQTMDEVTPAQLRRELQKIFASTGSNTVLVPQVDLGELLPMRIARQQSSNLQISTAQKIDSINISDIGIALISADNIHYDCDYLVIATEVSSAAALLKNQVALTTEQQQLAAVKTYSHLSVHLCYGELPASASLNNANDLALFINSQNSDPLSQAPLDSIYACSVKTRRRAELAEVFIITIYSNANKILAAHSEELILYAHSKLEEVLSFRLPTPQWSHCYHNENATNDLDEKRRINSQTAEPRIFLAGDYLDGCRRATLEMAVVSGQRAAAAIMRNLQNQP